MPALDGVRAFAVAAVLLYHGGVPWLPGGFLGVDVFFVLSGFLITSLLLAERAATGRVALRRFWARRARRLLPAAIVLIALCTLAIAVLDPAEAARTRGDALASLFYANNWHQVLAQRSYFESFGRPSVFQHLWSLAVEEQFYLLWPLALGLWLSRLGRRGTALVTLLGACASASAMALLLRSGADPSRVYFGTDTHASGLLIGALLAFAWPLGRLRPAPGPRAPRVLGAAALAALAALLAAMVLWHDYDTWVYRGGIFSAGLAAAVLIASAVHPSCRVSALLAARPMVWLGRRSYGIYLWHWPVMAMTRPGLDVAWSRWMLVPLQVAAAVALAAASYRWVEQPVRSGAARRWLDARPPRARLALAGGGLLAMLVAGAAVAGRTGATAAGFHPAGTRTAAAMAVPVRRAAATTALERDAAPARPALAVGASVMLAAQSSLGRHAQVDAAVGRQVSDVLGRLEAYRAAGRLPSRIVVQAGENGPLTDADLTLLRSLLAGARRVVLVNVRVPRSWEPEVNDRLRRAVTGWPQARLVDWYDASARPGVLYEDGTHPNLRGQRLYARLVERALAP